VERNARARIEDLKRQILDVTSGEAKFQAVPGLPVAVEEAVLKRILWYERVSRQPLATRLAEAGITLKHPAGLDDGQIRKNLWAVIHALVALDVIVCNTDHLSDRELYVHLWNQVSSGAIAVTPDFFSRGWYLDATGMGDEGLDIYLKYYASDEQRRHYRRHYPDRALPERTKPPFNRDHLTPDLPELADVLKDQMDELWGRR
jgi:hypothetical protein